ncbi:hypothetical protein VE02_01450 [Pseudogymnoascus sp. 03VT05]|nr:hypothetical protein VE02_01450 [Pseudogymnoascus sp. 03VT05]
MEHDTKTPQYLTSDRSSFAFASARSRWPVILTGAIDDVHRAVSALEPSQTDKREEGKRIVETVGALKYEVLHDRAMTPLEEDGGSDIEEYNRELAALGETTWLHAPWLFSECYLYRRIATHFARSTHWKQHDVFARQKISTFRSSRPAVLELATRYNAILSDLARTTPSAEAASLVFTEIAEISLWGNATDLSLLTSLSYADIQKLQGSEARKAAEKHILINDLHAAYDVLLKAQAAGGERTVDIILDNAGFELFADLLLAGYLLATGLATSVTLHPKSIPWFVSDVVPADFAALLSALHDPRAFFETASEEEEREGTKPAPLADDEVAALEALFAHWSGLHAEGALRMRPNAFWTAGGSFWRLPTSAPRLYEDLRESTLVVFKGDLNYRKLVADAEWAPTTAFAEALGPMGRASGVDLLSLRTCKADVVVGLPEGKDEELRAEQGDGEGRRWAWSGKWAVVSFSGGKKVE